MAEEDFEIDIYGDGSAADHDADAQESNAHNYENNTAITVANGSNNAHVHASSHDDYDAEEHHDDAEGHDSRTATPQPQQGVKRKEVPDDRPVDPGATNCLLISDLSWWTTDDDIRHWVQLADSEDELKDITFSEHKVNGKSKG
jgi:hypothetical protein